MPDLHYTDPRLAALYDVETAQRPDFGWFLALPGPEPLRILDLGCGTGVLAASFGRAGHRVTGADPAPSMLAIARARRGGDLVEWIRATAQDFRSPDRFDLVTMTGHAFQVLLDPSDRAGALATMRDHLAPDGRIAFDTRNPALDWPTLWTGEWELPTDPPIRQAWVCGPLRDGRLRFETHYRFPDGVHLVSESTLLFLPRETLEAEFAAAGLRVEDIRGDWDSSPFDPATSPEMIFTLRAAEG
jgi:SAM-dependent methyltransferase